MLSRFAPPPVYDVRYPQAVRLLIPGSFHSRLELSTGFESCATGRQARRRHEYVLGFVLERKGKASGGGGVTGRRKGAIMRPEEPLCMKCHEGSHGEETDLARVFSMVGQAEVKAVKLSR